jgi:Tfp pilus assembly protein PilW
MIKLFSPKQNLSIQKNGFSLVEILVYIAILLLVTVASVSLYLTFNTIFVRNEVERKLTYAANVTLERIVRDLRASDLVDLTPSTFNVSPGTLKLIQGATTSIYTLVGGDVTVTVDGIPLGLLTGEGVTADSLIFTRYAVPNAELVRVALTLSTHDKSASSTRTFYASGVLRGAYE